MHLSEDSQIVVPPSFVALFVPPGRIKPTAPREAIAERYELCEDLAQMLTEQAATALFKSGGSEADVLAGMRGALAGPDAGLSPAEAQWVVTRLAEVLGWELPPQD